MQAGIQLVHGVDHRADHTRCNIGLAAPVYLIPACGVDYVESPIAGQPRRVAWSTQYRDWTCPDCGGRTKVPKAPTATNLHGGRRLLASLAVAACFVLVMFFPGIARAAEGASDRTAETVLALGLALAIGIAAALALMLRVVWTDLRAAEEKGGRAAIAYDQVKPVHDAAVIYVRAQDAAERLVDTPGFKPALDRADEALTRLRRAVPGEGS